MCARHEHRHPDELVAFDLNEAELWRPVYERMGFVPLDRSSQEFDRPPAAPR